MSQSEAIRLLRQEEVFGEERRVDPAGLELREEMISLRRVAKVVKGGRRFSFSALVVVGDGKKHVGIGFGKANEVPDAIAKAVEAAKRSLIRVPQLGSTIPHQIIGRYGAARVMLKPAAPGTGLIAGHAVRTVMELGGIKDILTKSLGSDNVLNVLKAAMNGLESMLGADKVAWLCGKNLEEMVGRKRANLYLEGRDRTAQARYAREARESQAASFGGSDDEMLPSRDESDEVED